MSSKVLRRDQIQQAFPQASQQVILFLQQLFEQANIILPDSIQQTNDVTGFGNNQALNIDHLTRRVESLELLQQVNIGLLQRIISLEIQLAALSSSVNIRSNTSLIEQRLAALENNIVRRGY